MSIYESLKRGLEQAIAYEHGEQSEARAVVLETKKYGRWVYWSGWCGNHDMRIEDAVCSECGYKHPTVRWEQGDPRGEVVYEAVMNKLKDECPKCGALMQKE